MDEIEEKLRDIMILLPLLVLLPFLAAAVSFLAGKRLSGYVSVAFSSAVLMLTLLAVYLAAQGGLNSMAFSASYIPSLNLSFHLQLTQLSLILVVMTSIVFFAASLAGVYFIKASRLYNIIFLAAEGASLGVFLSANLLFLYVFWEVAEIMMFFIIFIFGRYDRKYAAIKFIIYSLLSSMLLLVAILVLYTAATPHTFNIGALAGLASQIPQQVQLLVVVLLTVAFMIKIPVFPFHTWLPDAHTEAPTTGSMILAGVLLKFGGYGLLLMFLMLPLSHAYTLYMALLFGFSAVYSALVTLKQTNMKRLIAYTSITDMGIISVGIAASNLFGTSGALYGMMGHALAISLLFLIAGIVDEAYGTLEIGNLKRIIAQFPALAYLFIAGVFAALGLPLTAGFIGDLLIFIGSFKAFGLLGVAPLAGLFIAGAALFWTVERVFLGASEPTVPYGSVGRGIILQGAVLLAASIALGVLPFLLLGISRL